MQPRVNLPRPPGWGTPEDLEFEARLREELQNIDTADALVDFPFVGTARGNDGIWYRAGRGRKVRLPDADQARLEALYGPGES